MAVTPSSANSQIPVIVVRNIFESHMRFENIIENISPIFLNNDFIISELSRNYVKYESDVIAFTFSFDPRENTYYAYSGNRDSVLSELFDSQLMREVFEEDFTMFQKQSIDEYIINFLKGRGNALLKGNPDVLERLDAYTNRKAKEFTKKIVNLQNLKMADAAWANKDYAGFIKYINLIDHSSLQESYIKKYKIAKSKVRQEDN